MKKKEVVSGIIYDSVTHYDFEKGKAEAITPFPFYHNHYMNLTPNNFKSYFDCQSTVLTINNIFKDRMEFLYKLTLNSYVSFIKNEIQSLDYYKKKEIYLDYLYNHLLSVVFEEEMMGNIISNVDVYWDQKISYNNYMNIVYAIASAVYTKTVDYFINYRIDIPFELLTAANFMFIQQLAGDIEKVVEEFNNFHVPMEERMYDIGNKFLPKEEISCTCDGSCGHCKE